MAVGQGEVRDWCISSVLCFSAEARQPPASRHGLSGQPPAVYMPWGAGYCNVLLLEGRD